MDSFEWNKILGAVLGTLLLVFIVNEVANILYHTGEPAEEMAYRIEIPEGDEQQAGPGEPEAVDFGKLLQQASAEQGENVAKRCLQCHSFEKGGPHKTGPNLWGILGAEIAAKDGFRYSNALSQKEGEWTYENVYEFVAAPTRWAPGTNMNFAGLRRQQERIDLLAYMRTQADSPPPIPEPLPEQSGEATEGAGENGGAAPAADGAAEGDAGPASGEAPAENGAAADAGGDSSPDGNSAGEEEPAESGATPGQDGAADEGGF
jgi:cytochrome c